MSHEIDNKKEAENQKNPSFLDRFSPPEIVGYVAVGCGLILTSLLSIRQTFSDNLKKLGVFDEINQKLKDDLQTNLKAGKKLPEAMKIAQKTFDDARDKILDDNGFGGSFKRFKQFAHLKPHQQYKIILTVLTVISVAVVGIFTIRSEQKLQGEAQRKHDQAVKNIPNEHEIPNQANEEIDIDNSKAKPILGDKTAAALKRPDISGKDDSMQR